MNTKSFQESVSRERLAASQQVCSLVWVVCWSERWWSQTYRKKDIKAFFLWYFSYKRMSYFRIFCCLQCARKSHVWENWKLFLRSPTPPNDYVGKFEFNRARRSSFFSRTWVFLVASLFTTLNLLSHLRACYGEEAEELINKHVDGLKTVCFSITKSISVHTIFFSFFRLSRENKFFSSHGTEK